MNIYTRQNDNDLLKYLSEQEINMVNTCSQDMIIEGNILFKYNEKFYCDLAVIAKGRCEMFIKNSIQDLIPLEEFTVGELLWELPFVMGSKTDLYFKTYDKLYIVLYKKERLEEFEKTNQLIISKIYAALNDSLCEKNIRITQKLMRKT